MPPTRGVGGKKREGKRGWDIERERERERVREREGERVREREREREIRRCIVL